MRSIETVQSIYQAFGRGDVPAILEKVSPEADWDYGHTVDVPNLKPQRGREGVGVFFQAIADNLEIRALDREITSRARATRPPRA